MKLVTAEEMKEIDSKAIEGLGIPGAVLMEQAGIGLFQIIKEEFTFVGAGQKSGATTRVAPTNEMRRLKIGIVCGKGNNGGDGFVLARHLLNNGIETEVFLLGKVEEVKGDARLNLDILLSSGYKITEIISKKDLGLLKSKQFDLLVDAIFGTGFKGRASGTPEEMIDIMNESGIPILAVDVPSGLNASTGEVEGVCIGAEFTGTMCLPKRGLFLYPGRDYAGTVYVIDIGVPPQLWEHIKLEMLEPTELRDLLPPRPDDSNKGTFGRVFVLSGSRGMTGAASLTSLSALRIGAGLVRLGIPESLNPILETKATEAITVPLPETADGAIAEKAIDKILSEIERATVVVIGPGLSTHPETKKLIQKLVPKIRIPLVIDADGLNNLNIDLLKGIESPTIITPHPGELSRLIGVSIPEIQRQRVGIAWELAKELGLTLVLKGAATIIAGRDKCYLNPIYESALAKGGSGDVLAGVIGGLLAQGLSPSDAARLGVYLHARAGEIAAEKLTKYSPLASDVMELIPEVIKELQEAS